MVKICTVIPTFNRKDDLIQLLGQLELQSRELEDVENAIIAVVDGSTDGTIEMLAREFPEVIVVRGNGDWWYTKSMNEGFLNAAVYEPEAVLCLNDDTILSDDYLCRIIESRNRVPVGSIVGSISYTSTLPRKVTFAGVKKILWWRNKLIRYFPVFAEIDPNSISGIYKSEILVGRGLLIPFDVLESLNYFDVVFSQYFSDMDFSLRAQKMGICSYISWDAKLYGHVEKTGGGSSFLQSDLKTFLQSFFNANSRIYILSITRYLYRHGIKYLLPLTFAISITSIFYSYFFKRARVQKLGQQSEGIT